LQRTFGEQGVDWGNQQVVNFRGGWAAPTNSLDTVSATKRSPHRKAADEAKVGAAHPTDDVISQVHTKRRGGIDLTLFTEAGTVTLGRVADLGHDRIIKPHRNGRDAIRIRFRT